MTKDRKKLNEYNTKYRVKLKKLGVIKLHTTGTLLDSKCPKCGRGFMKKSKIYKKRSGSKNSGKSIRYHQKCWDKMIY